MYSSLGTLLWPCYQDEAGEVPESTWRRGLQTRKCPVNGNIYLGKRSADVERREPQCLFNDESAVRQGLGRDRSVRRSVVVATRAREGGRLQSRSVAVKHGRRQENRTVRKKKKREKTASIARLQSSSRQKGRRLKFCVLISVAGGSGPDRLRAQECGFSWRETAGVASDGLSSGRKARGMRYAV